MNLKNFLNNYIKNSLKHKKYEISDIYRLVAFSIKTSKNYIYTNIENINLSDDDIKIVEKNLNLYYKDNIPLQYILGVQSFYNEEYIVNENVLIPRADSEILVETAIKYINDNNLKNMIDMCTGTGCIGISIAKNSNIENVVLVDISSKAIEIAKSNVIKNNVKNVTCIVSNLFNTFFDLNNKKYDIIVSNPPYIPTSDIISLDEKVLKEPILALDGGYLGMQFYEKILEQAQNILSNNGYLIFEIGYDELEKFKDILLSFKCYELLENLKDYNGNDRVVVCRFLQK